jgi:hypothetical protein
MVSSDPIHGLWWVVRQLHGTPVTEKDSEVQPVIECSSHLAEDVRIELTWSGANSRNHDTRGNLTS